MGFLFVLFLYAIPYLAFSNIFLRRNSTFARLISSCFSRCVFRASSILGDLIFLASVRARGLNFCRGVLFFFLAALRRRSALCCTALAVAARPLRRGVAGGFGFGRFRRLRFFGRGGSRCREAALIASACALIRAAEETRGGGGAGRRAGGAGRRAGGAGRRAGGAARGAGRGAGRARLRRGALCRAGMFTLCACSCRINSAFFTQRRIVQRLPSHFFVRSLFRNSVTVYVFICLLAHK